MGLVFFPHASSARVLSLLFAPADMIIHTFFLKAMSLTIPEIGLLQYNAGVQHRTTTFLSIG